jgi:hypothetical protein
MKTLAYVSIAAIVLASVPAVAEDVPSFADVDACGIGEVDFSDVHAHMPGIDQATFNAADLDSNGTLNSIEYDSLKPKLTGMTKPASTQTDVAAAAGEMTAFAIVDCDGNGNITLDELRAVYGDAADAAFGVGDADSDGVLDAPEYEAAVVALGAK